MRSRASIALRHIRVHGLAGPFSLLSPMGALKANTAAGSTSSRAPEPRLGGAVNPCYEHSGSGDPAHLALIYADEAEYAEGIIEFLAPGLESGDPVALALPGSRAALVRERLGDAANAVQLLDIRSIARNPARMIPFVLTMLEGHAGRCLHYVSEPAWPGRSREEIEEVLRHEALINLAWPGAALRVLCPYDAGRHDEAVLRDVERTHPWLMRDGGVARNTGFGGSAFPPGTDNPLPPAPADATVLTFALEDLATVRAVVAQCGDLAGRSGAQRDDLVIAVNEVATNAIKYGPHDGLLRIWSTAHAVVCQLEDRGHIVDPLAGRHRPVPGSEGGLGLWMVNQLCDLVQTRTTPSGTTIRLHARLD